jgi:hypothetical protein
MTPKKLPQPPPEKVWTAAFRHLASALPKEKGKEQGA